MKSLKDWLLIFGRVWLWPTRRTLLGEANKAKDKSIGTILWLMVFSAIPFYIYDASLFSSSANGPDAIVLFIISLWQGFIAAFIFISYFFSIYWISKKFFPKKIIDDERIRVLLTGIYVPLLAVDSVLFLLTDSISILFWLFIGYAWSLTVKVVKIESEGTYLQSIMVVLLGTLVGIIGFFFIPSLISHIETLSGLGRP